MSDKKYLNITTGSVSIVISILLVIIFVYVTYSDAKNLEFENQQNEFRAELCKDYFLKLGGTEYIILDDPEFYTRKDNEIVCTIKLGYNCSGCIVTTNNKTFAMNVCEKVAYAGLNMDILANETLTGSEREKIEWFQR